MDRPTFSDILADRRRELGFSIRQASRVLRLREDVLVAFEEGDFEHMPKTGYAQGMLSSYARYLGLDPNEILLLYTSERESREHESRRRNRSGSRGRRDRQRARGSVRHNTTRTTSSSRQNRDARTDVHEDERDFDTTRVKYRNHSSDETLYEAAESGLERTRPYTARVPRTSTSGYRDDVYRRDGDISLMSPSQFSYEDDLRERRDTRSYTRASTSRGRQRSQDRSLSERPRVRRQVSGRSRQSERRGSRSSVHTRGGGIGQLVGDATTRSIVVAVAVVLLITAVLVFSVSSCIRAGQKEGYTVPVSELNEDSAVEENPTSDQSQASSETTDAEDQTAEAGVAEVEDQLLSDTPARETAEETSVSVSVLDGSVTWLEVECDGVSDVAETITGPWQKTYTVEDSITIQAGDTTAVAIVQNGRQVQFDSTTSGIGTLRIQGTKKPETDDEDEASGDAGDTDGQELDSSDADATATL